MVKNIKAGMNIFRNQYQNFEESLGNFHNGGVGKTGRKKDSDMVHVTTDGTVLDITELTQANRADGLTRLSNDPSIAYRHSTPDHRFKTAKYSMVRENQDLSKQDWSNTRRSARLDHANFAIIDGTMVNKELAALIMDIQGIREAQHMASTGAEYGKSEQSVNKQMKSRADELAKLLRAAQTSQTQSAHQQLGGELLNKKSRNPADTNVRNLANQPEFNHEIARCMEQSTKKQRERDRKDLREQIQQTGESFGVYHEDAPRNFNRCHLTANQTRHDEADHYIEDQKTIVNYITMVPFTNQKRMQNTSWEDYAGESDLNLDRSSRLKGHALITADDSVEGQDRSQLDLDPGTFIPEFKTDAYPVMSFCRQQQLIDQGTDYGNQKSDTHPTLKQRQKNINDSLKREIFHLTSALRNYNQNYEYLASLQQKQNKGFAESASGYIPSKKQAKDPRFSSALTVDIKPDSIQKNAKAFGSKISRAGIPPIARSNGKI